MSEPLTPELWRRVEPILGRALDLPADERTAYLDEACGDDAELRATLDRLIEADAGQTGEFLESLAAAVPTIVSRPAAVPKEIAGYRIERVLGEGGMGIVYLAEQREPLERLVAVKVLKLGMDTAQVVKRFEAERQALAVMDHPSIARVFDAGATEDGRPYFVMEYVDGVSITDYCDREGIAIDERLELIARVCDAIQHAHYKGVIHRDIKPSNVLITETDGRPVPKVIDFGIAKAIDQRSTERTLFTEHGQFVGTPAYMSPEQAGASDQDIDTRTDVYSLGVLLYELLAGSLPFDPRDLRLKGYEAIQKVIRETDPPRPSARLRTLSGEDGADERGAIRRVEGELDWVVMKAIEKDRSRRYATPSALELDLRRFLSNQPVAARPTSAAYRFRKFARRHRAGVASAIVAAVAVFVGVAGLAWGLIEARTQRDEAERQTAIATAVNDFLNDDLLAGANPEQGGGRQVTLFEVVERAALEVEERFPDQPTVEAAIRSTLAKTFIGLGEYAAAETQALGAIEAVDQTHGRKSLESIRARIDLAVSYAHVARYDEAEPLFREILVDAREVLGLEHRTTLTTMSNLAFVYDNAGRYDESVPMHEEVFRSRERTLGATHQDTLISMNNVAFVYYQQGRTEEAEAMFVRRVELCPEVFGPTHPETFNAMITLASVYANQKKFDDSERLLLEVLDRGESVLGERHPMILMARNSLGIGYYHQQDFERAAPLLQETFEARRETLGSVHPMTLYSASTHATVLCELGREDEALRLFEETVAGYREMAPQGTVEAAGTLSRYGECLARLERYEQAEEYMLEGAAMEEGISGEDSEYFADHARSLARLYEAWGRPDQAAIWKKRGQV